MQKRLLPRINFEKKKNSRRAELASSNIPAKSELFLPSTDHYKFRFRERDLSFCLSLSLSLSISGSQDSSDSVARKLLRPSWISAFAFLIQTATYVDNSKKDNQHKYKHLEKEIYEKFSPINLD